jgi:hypothetical protein
LQRRRERAIALLAEGYQPVEVARRVGADRRSVRRWKAAYRKRGRLRHGRPADYRPGRVFGQQIERAAGSCEPYGKCIFDYHFVLRFDSMSVHCAVHGFFSTPLGQISDPPVALPR